MSTIRVHGFPLTREDIVFLLETVDSKLVSRLDTFMGDHQLVEGMLDQEAGKLYRRLMDTEGADAWASVTPRLLFEVLLREAARGIRQGKYTLERSASHRIPVFDALKVAGFLANKDVLSYLADMLSSFTRVDNYVVQVRVGKGIWRKIRFSDMDLHSLERLCQSAKEEDRFACYKRAADLCLFILGMFPESVASNPAGPAVSPKALRRLNMSAEDYEEEGKRYYKLACEHRDAEELDLVETLAMLHQNFILAKKPLNYISDNFVRFRKQQLFKQPSSN